MYPAELTAPMAQELENAGFKSLKTSEEVKTVTNVLICIMKYFKFG